MARSIDEWSEERQIHRKRRNYVDAELTDEQRDAIRDAHARGYGVITIHAYMREVHGTTGLTQGALQHWLNKEGLTRAGH